MITPEGEEEIRAISEFKKRVKEFKPDNVTCLRFLRARELNLDKAENLYRRSLKWREDLKISTFLHWRPSKCVEEDTIFGCTGHDNEGRPVLWMPLGRWNARGWVEKGYKEDITNMRYYILETVMYHIGKSVADQCVVIFGIEGLTYWKVAHLESMQILMDSLKDLGLYYPEIIKRIFVINTPWYWPYVMTFVKPILSKRTWEKIKIFDSDKEKWLPSLLESIPSKSLPKEYLNTPEIS